MIKLSFIFIFLFSFFSCKGKEITLVDYDEKDNNEEKTPGKTEEPVPSLPSGAIVDMVLIYGGGAHRSVVWDKEHFAPYVSYTGRDNKESWLFDGFLMLEISNGKQKIFATGYYGTPATKTEWKALADYYFTPGQCVDALNTCIAEKIQTLGAPSKKRKIVVGIPEPIVAGPNSNYKDTPADYWGEIDGRKLDFNVQNDRVIACRWYIDYIKTLFDAGNFSNLELEGFYWIAEETLHTKTILTTIGKYLENDGYSFNWIPYWKEKPDYFEWKELGFHHTYLQPNYFFNEQIPYSRLVDACKIAKQYNLDMELEFDLRVFAGAGSRAYRLHDYMKAFRIYGILNSKRIAYYQDCDAVYQLSVSPDEENKALLRDFCEFVLEHQTAIGQ